MVESDVDTLLFHNFRNIRVVEELHCEFKVVETKVCLLVSPVDYIQLVVFYGLKVDPHLVGARAHVK